MPDLARLTPCWPGNWVVEGMEMLCFKAKEPPTTPRGSSEPKPCATAPHSPAASDPGGHGGGGCRDPTETPNRHCGQGIYLSYMCLSHSRL